MVTIKKFKKKSNISDTIKILISGILISLIFISNVCINLPYLTKIIISIIFLCLTFKILILTKRGKKGFVFVKNTLHEIEMIIWPTFKDTLNTTVIVILITIIIALILWSLDNLLIYLISFITSLRL